MNAFWQTSTFFGIFITLFFYGVGMFLKQKVKHSLVNPLLIAIVFTGTTVPSAGYTETKF